LVDGKCPDHPNGEIEKIQEENYFFRLSKYRDQVKRLIQDDIYEIYPASRKNEMLAFIEKANDISFSRPKSSLPRGIPVPGDENHVMYVRCDALSNYITGQ
jgi:methionyl-tRNA synthetase